MHTNSNNDGKYEQDYQASRQQRQRAEIQRALVAQQHIDLINAWTTAEEQRVITEEVRASAEAERCSSEEDRLVSEERRSLAERGRRVAEDLRKATEEARLAAEQLRQAAEEVRQCTYEQMFVLEEMRQTVREFDGIRLELGLRESGKILPS